MKTFWCGARGLLACSERCFLPPTLSGGDAAGSRVLVVTARDVLREGEKKSVDPKDSLDV